MQVKKLELKEEFCKSAYQEYLTEADNPLTPINNIWKGCSLLNSIN